MSHQYADASLALTDLAQLLWAAQGVTAASRFRTAPSGVALTELSKVTDEENSCMSVIPPRRGAVILIAAVYERTTAKYSARACYVQMEVGHAAQNMYLQAVALDAGQSERLKRRERKELRI